MQIWLDDRPSVSLEEREQMRGRPVSIMETIGVIRPPNGLVFGTSNDEAGETTGSFHISPFSRRAYRRVFHSKQRRTLKNESSPIPLEDGTLPRDDATAKYRLGRLGRSIRKTLTFGI